MMFQEKCFTSLILLTNQISWSGCRYFLRYWVICALQLFDSQAVTSYVLELTLSFASSHFSTWPKFKDKSSNILRTKRAFKVKWKVFIIILKTLSVAKIFLRPESAPLILIEDRLLKSIYYIGLFEDFLVVCDIYWVLNYLLYFPAGNYKFKVNNKCIRTGV